jgi:magnesium transporter
MQKVYKIQDKKLVESANTDGHVIVCVSADSNDIALLTSKYGIDPHNIQSALDPDEPSRIEFEPDHMVMIMKRPKNYSSDDNFLFKVASVGLFMFEDRIILLVSDDHGIFEAKHPVAIESVKDVLLRTISGIISHFNGHLKVINMISDDLEKKINLSMENRYLLNMFSLEKSLVYYLSATHFNNVVIDKLRGVSTKTGFTPDHMEFLEDLSIENNQCTKQAEIYSNILASLMDARASIVNNNLNVLMKQLTLISVVFMPLNVIAGIGGMSEFSMMTGRIPWPISYSVLTVMLVLIGLATYSYLKKFGTDRSARKKKPAR